MITVEFTNPAINDWRIIMRQLGKNSGSFLTEFRLKTEATFARTGLPFVCLVVGRAIGHGVVLSVSMPDRASNEEWSVRNVWRPVKAVHYAMIQRADDLEKKAHGIASAKNDRFGYSPEVDFCMGAFERLGAKMPGCTTDVRAAHLMFDYLDDGLNEVIHERFTAKRALAESMSKIERLQRRLKRAANF